MSNPNEIFFSGSVFNLEQKYIKKFLEISIFDQLYQLKTVNSETVSNVNEIRNCNSPLNSEQDYVNYISKDLCIWPVKSVKTRYFPNDVTSEWLWN